MSSKEREFEPNRPQELTGAVGLVVGHALLRGFDGAREVALVGLEARIFTEELCRLDVGPLTAVDVAI